MSGYEIGTVIQEKNGRVKVKVGKSKWKSRGRLTYEQTNKTKLDENQRVFHIDGDRKNDDPKNLVPIRFSGVRYRLIRSVVLWRPATGQKQVLIRPSANGSKRVAVAA